MSNNVTILFISAHTTFHTEYLVLPSTTSTISSSLLTQISATSGSSASITSRGSTTTTSSLDRISGSSSKPSSFLQSGTSIGPSTSSIGVASHTSVTSTSVTRFSIERVSTTTSAIAADKSSSTSSALSSTVWAGGHSNSATLNGVASTTTASSSSPTAKPLGVEATTAPTTTHTVGVGGTSSSAFQFHPRVVDAAVGDIILFQFLARNHTVTQSSLEKPCVANEQFDTGFAFFNPTNQSDITQQQSAYLVRDSNPAFFFCKQEDPFSHCHKGMVFGLNIGDKLSTFLTNAESAGPTHVTRDLPSGIAHSSKCDHSDCVSPLTLLPAPATGIGYRGTDVGPAGIVILIIWVVYSLLH